MGLQTGFENNKWYTEYMRSPAWHAKANERLKMDNFKCCVCGRQATQVHHLTYEHFRHEQMEDLVSLCADCHKEAEDIYNPAVTPWTDWANGKGKIGENNFMAAMRIDAETIAQIIFDYLLKVRGTDFQSLWAIRQPTSAGGKDHWSVLRKAVEALSRKRYENNAFDRIDIAERTITNHTIALICMAAIEHDDRNFIQSLLQDAAIGAYEAAGNRKKAADSLGINISALDKLRKDDGSTSGPTLRDSVFYYCGVDAAAGIKPLRGFPCLTPADYESLDNMAEHAVEITHEEFD